MMDIDERILDEVGNDTDDDELIDDVGDEVRTEYSIFRELNGLETRVLDLSFFTISQCV